MVKTIILVYTHYLNSRFRGNDENGTKRTFYEFIIFYFWIIFLCVLGDLCGK